MEISELYKIIYNAEQASNEILMAVVVSRMNKHELKKLQKTPISMASFSIEYAANSIVF